VLRSNSWRVGRGAPFSYFASAIADYISYLLLEMCVWNHQASSGVHLNGDTHDSYYATTSYKRWDHSHTVGRRGISTVFSQRKTSCTIHSRCDSLPGVEARNKEDRQTRNDWRS
jgi:hypothetical protein